MPWVAGIDGCRAGWVVVLIEPHETSPPQPLEVRLCSTFEAVLSLQPTPTVMAIDMPIGLLETPRPGGRTCDQHDRHEDGIGERNDHAKHCLLLVQM